MDVSQTYYASLRHPPVHGAESWTNSPTHGQTTLTNQHALPTIPNRTTTGTTRTTSTALSQTLISYPAPVRKHTYGTPASRRSGLGSNKKKRDNEGTEGTPNESLYNCGGERFVRQNCDQLGEVYRNLDRNLATGRPAEVDLYTSSKTQLTDESSKNAAGTNDRWNAPRWRKVQNLIVIGFESNT